MVSGFNHSDIGTIDLANITPNEPVSLGEDVHAKLLQISKENLKPLYMTLDIVNSSNNYAGKVSTIMTCVHNPDIALYQTVVMMFAPTLVVIGVKEDEAYIVLSPLGSSEV